MKVSGNSLAPNAKLQTLTPLDFGRQHIKREIVPQRRAAQ